MAQALVIGGVTVPIIRTYHFPNQTNPTAVPNIVISAFTVWSDGVTYARDIIGPTWGDTDTFSDGDLDIHDNTVIRFTKEYYSGDRHALVIRVKQLRNGAETSLPGFITSDISVHPGSYQQAYMESYETRLAAIMFDFPDATRDEWKIPNYFVYSVQGRVIYREDGSVRETSYTPTRLLFNFAYANYYNNQYHMYLDPIDVPDHDNDPNEQDPDYPSSPSDPEGDYERDYDPIPVPPIPSDGAADAGFVTIYRMTFREFDEFASKCFADDVWSAIKLKFNNPTDFLVGALLLPFIPDVGLSYYPKFGLKTLDTAYPRISNQFHDVDCGSVNITKYWGNCFDFEPYTKIQIWLPYIGYKDLPVDEFMGQTISVKYRCDCLTGDCIAFVYTGVVGETGPQVERVIAQFYGNCGVRVPFGSQSFDAAVAAGITLIGAAAASGLVAAGSAAVGAESGAGVLMSAGQAAGGAATGAVGRAASVGVVQGMKPNVQHGGAAGASGGYMGIQKPYLIRRIPRQSLPEGFMNLKGYPSNIGGKLSDFTGLAIVDDIQLNNIPAMEDERKEIIDWLRGGVLI